MGKRPIALLRYTRRDADTFVTPRPLEGDWRDEYALIYDAAASRGIGPAECDACEIWVLAAALGANRPDDEDPLMDESGLTWNQQRAVKLARGEDEPSWDDVPMSPQEIAQMQRLMADAPQAMMPPADVPPV